VAFACSLGFPRVPEVICVPGVTHPGAQRQFSVVDPGLVVDRGDRTAPDAPRSLDPPRNRRLSVVFDAYVRIWRARWPGALTAKRAAARQPP